MVFPNPDDLLNFTLTIEPDEGSLIYVYDESLTRKACTKAVPSISPLPSEMNTLTNLPKFAALKKFSLLNSDADRRSTIPTSTRRGIFVSTFFVKIGNQSSTSMP